MARGFGGADRILESGLGSWFFFDGLVGIAKVKLIVFAACIALGLALDVVPRALASRAKPSAPPRRSRARAAVLGIDTRRVYRPHLCAQCRDLRRRRRARLDGLHHPPLWRAVLHHPLLHDRGGGRARQSRRRRSGRRSGLGVAESFAGFILGPQYQIAFVFALLVAVLRAAAIGGSRPSAAISDQIGHGARHALDPGAAHSSGRRSFCAAWSRR